MAEKKKALNLTISDDAREALQELAAANEMSISQLVRFLSLKVLDKPEEFGLRVPKDFALAI